MAGFPCAWDAAKNRVRVTVNAELLLMGHLVNEGTAYLYQGIAGCTLLLT
jgi:hypothetical protein